MAIIQDGDVIHLRGQCRVEDAEPLAALLQAAKSSVLDLSACEGLHAAVAQAILAFRPTVVGNTGDAFLDDHLLPALTSERQAKMSQL